MLTLMLLQRLVKDFYKILNEVKTGEIPANLKLPDSFDQLVSDMKNNQYDAKTFAFMLRGMVSCLLHLNINEMYVLWLIGICMERIV